MLCDTLQGKETIILRCTFKLIPIFCTVSLTFNFEIISDKLKASINFNNLQLLNSTIIIIRKLNHCNTNNQLRNFTQMFPDLIRSSGIPLTPFY